MTLGQKIKQRRKKLKITQVELAKKMKTSQSYVSQVESDDLNPSTPMIVNIALLLNLSIDYLLLEERRAN
ncbi:MAG: helix-turn-helix domain-containing protein [Oscillospiraceae bacterium]|nr:helix-turn-helix domain-containing protein [Oscillospiraceae bacterium]